MFCFIPSQLYQNLFGFKGLLLFLSVAQSHTPPKQHHLPVWHASCAGDPLQISKPHTHKRPKQKTDFRSPKQNCPQRTISTKLLRFSWWAVSLICLSPTVQPGHSLVCYALASPLWKTSPMREVEEIFKKKRKISHSLRNKVFFPASHCWQPAITHVVLIPNIFMWNWSKNVVWFAFFCNTWSSWLFRSKIFV